MTEQTILLRQVHPSFVQNGRPTSQAFRPTPKDEHQLSTYDGDQIKAEPAWEHYTETQGFSSAGVLGITVEECSEQGLKIIPDPIPFPEHVLVDFSEFPTGQIDKKAKLLKAKAEARGWLYGPVPN